MKTIFKLIAVALFCGWLISIILFFPSTLSDGVESRGGRDIPSALRNQRAANMGTSRTTDSKLEKVEEMEDPDEDEDRVHEKKQRNELDQKLDENKAFDNDDNQRGDADGENNNADSPLADPEIEHNKALEEFYQWDGKPNPCPSRVWTKAELSSPQYNGATDAKSGGSLLISVRGRVLDVTTFLPNHPGGDALKQASNGVDGGDMFMMYHQPSTVQMFDKMCVGMYTP